MTTLRLPVIPALLSLTLGLALPAAAQRTPPEVPSTTELAERVGKLLDAAPDETLEVPGLARLVYKRLPMDAHAVAMAFGQTLTGAQDPQGTALDRYVRQFEPRIQHVLDERLANVGTLEVLAPLKGKSGPAIAAGTWRLGVVVERGQVAGLVLSRDPAERVRPVAIKLKPRRPEGDAPPEGALAIRLVPPATPTEGAERFDVAVRLLEVESATANPLVKAPARGPSP